MKIEIFTKDQNALLKKIRKRYGIESAERTGNWKMIQHQNVEYLTYGMDDFYFRILVGIDSAYPEKLVFNMRWFADDVPSKEMFGFYASRVVEEMLVHFPDSFRGIQVFP